MFIKCEKCGAVFDIDTSFIQQKRSFKCGICAHTFTYTPDLQEKNEPVLSTLEQPIETSDTTVPEIKMETTDLTAADIPQSTVEPPSFFVKESKKTSDVPEITLPEEFIPITDKPKSHWFLKSVLFLIGIACITAAVCLYMITSNDSDSTSETNAQILNDSTELEIIDTSFKIVPNAEGTMRLIIQGALYNPTTKTKPTRPVWVELYDENNTVIDSRQIMPLQPKIMGNITLPFYTEITPVPENFKQMKTIFK